MQWDLLPVVVGVILFWLFNQHSGAPPKPLPTSPSLSRANLPRIGLGTAALHEETLQVVTTAFSLGFRLIDTASDTGPWYRNEAAIGTALAARERKDIWISTKVHPLAFGVSETRQSVQRSLQNLQTSYVDVAFIHYPNCFDAICDRAPAGTWQDALRVLVALQEEGLVKHIGVSNFDYDTLSEAFRMLLPAKGLYVVQNYYDLFHQDFETRAFCARNRIIYQAYSLFGGQYWNKPANPVLTDPDLVQIARDRGLAPAQALAAFALQEGVHILVRSKNSLHLQEILSVNQTDALSESGVHLLRTKSL